MRIKEAREKAHLTQEQLAEVLNCSPQYVSLMETGRYLISIKMLRTLCTELKVSSDAILFGDSAEVLPSSVLKRLSELDDKKLNYARELICLFLAAMDSGTEG